MHSRLEEIWYTGFQNKENLVHFRQGSLYVSLVWIVFIDFKLYCMARDILGAPLLVGKGGGIPPLLDVIWHVIKVIIIIIIIIIIIFPPLF